MGKEDVTMLFIRKNILKFILSLVICFGAASIGAYFTLPAVKTWYPQLIKPWFAPPDFIFGPVWTLLYFLMAISFYLVWTSEKDKNYPKAIKSFIVQLVLNILWSIVFFGFHSILGGLIVIILLWLAIIMMIKNFYPVSPLASLLQIPYLLWVTFATILNFAIYTLNV